MLINDQEFLIKEIPVYHPKSRDYIQFWKSEGKKVIDGTWLGGYYMPPSLYFYVNYSTIQVQKKYQARKSYSRPWLREIEWELFQSWTVAQGFSGFKDDPEFSCHKALIDDSININRLKEDLPHLFKPDGTPKEYIDPLKYLKMRHPAHYLYPAYENSLYNLMILGSRDSGKSFAVGTGMVLHQWLTDGVSSTYAPKDPELPDTVDITVGAEGADKSKLIMDKIKLALDFLPGGQTVAGRYYPSPFSKRFSGSFALGKEIVAEYKVKVDGAWETKGSRSKLKHRSFKNNPFADQGSRPSSIVLEECGLFSNLKEVYYNTKDNLRNGMRKTGSLIMMGTGGDMDKGTLDAAEMFYNPESYEILPFDDSYEHRGKIGFFIPAYMVLTDQMDDNRKVIIEDALKHLNKERDKAKAHSSDKLSKELQYRPLKPSEMFISKSANIFPTPELRRRLAEIETDKYYESTRIKAELYFDPNTPHGVNYSVSETLSPIDSFPLKDDSSREGAVVLYDLPYLKDNKVPEGMYIIGCDPFKDDNPDGSSLASIYVVKTSKYPHLGFNEIVASYVGRPFMGKNAVNEILHKLSLFYGNAKIYFENSVGNVKDYFEKVKRLDLLATQPVTVFNKKASYATGPSMIYGYPMSNDKVKWEALQYLRSFLLEERGIDGDTIKRNLDVVPDVGLLKELIYFNLDGNFDRVMSMVGCVIGLEETQNLNKRKLQYEDSRTDLQKDIDRLLVNNRRLFRTTI